ncbi:hypothetical protein [Aliiglaciecola litoralis]
MFGLNAAWYWAETNVATDIKLLEKQLERLNKNETACKNVLF